MPLSLIRAGISSLASAGLLSLASRSGRPAQEVASPANPGLDPREHSH